jgi:hypothetical protein
MTTEQIATLDELEYDYRLAMERFHAGWVRRGRDAAWAKKQPDLVVYDHALISAEDDRDLAWTLFIRR